MVRKLAVKRRIIISLLTLIMVVSAPLSAFADTNTGGSSSSGTSASSSASAGQQKIGTGIYKVDGQWKYYENGVFKAATGLAKNPNNGKWYYVEKGKYTKRTTITRKIVRNGDDNWYYVENGAYKKSTGLVKRHDNGQWYYVEKGVYKKKTTITKKVVKNGDNRWFFVDRYGTYSKITGLARRADTGKWYYIKNGVYDKTFTGIAPSFNNGKYYYVKNGAYTKYTGNIKFRGKSYQIVEGHVVGGVPLTNIYTPGQSSGTASDIINVMRSWLGRKKADGTHKEIIDIYNDYPGPYPMSHKVTYAEAWCDAGLSAAAIVAGCANLIGREYWPERHVTVFKQLKIWIEDGKIVPKPGYILVYSWRSSKQPNNTDGTHIGIVESVKGNKITVLECNYDGVVKRRVVPVGWGYIRGYAAPRYAVSSSKDKAAA